MSEHEAIAAHLSGTRAGRATAAISVAMLLGVATGWLLHSPGVAASPGQSVQPAIIELLSLVSELFVRLARMVVGPLVLLNLIAGLAGMANGAGIGRITIRAMLWFIVMSALSLTLGLAAAHILEPGAGMALAPQRDMAPPELKPPKSLSDVLVDAVPVSIFDALARNNLLQVVVFAIFCGLSVARLPENQLLLSLFRQGARLMLEVTRRVMWFAPAAVFAAIASNVARSGPGILLAYGRLIGSFYLALALLALLIVAATGAFLRRKLPQLLSAVRVPVLLAFATASSEAAFGPAIAALSRIGLPSRLITFVLPLGYSFNVDGTMMFSAFGVMFIAQAFHVPLPLTSQLELMFLIFIMSKGAAGVPRGALISLAANLDHFGLPQAGLVLLLSVDQIMDMGRTALNVFSNCCATAVVAELEDEAAAHERPSLPEADSDDERSPDDIV